ncbi:tetratricopeptide repeat protein [Humidesulfovibrio sp.]
MGTTTDSHADIPLWRRLAPILASSLLIIAVFMVFPKLIDYFFLRNLHPLAQNCTDNATIEVSNFQTYSSFVTTITGLLALIIGAIGIGSYISFQKFKEEEGKITDRRNQLDMFLKIEEARNISESDAAYSTAIKLYDEAEKFHCNYYMLYVLRGEAYYFRNETGDLQNAVKDFELAIKLKKNSSRAWFGLGQARFKLIVKKHWRASAKERNLKGICASLLTLANNDGLVNAKGEIQIAMDDIETAISFQYAETPARLELGKMYKLTGDNQRALHQYKMAYESNKFHAACGFTYALLWLVENDDRLDSAEQEGILNILKKSSVDDVFNSKAAYALLWFLYERLERPDDAKTAKAMTDQMIIDQLFELRPQ